MLLARNSRLSTRCSRRRRLVLGAIAGLVTLSAGAIFGVSDTRAQESKPATQDRTTIQELEKQRDDLIAEIAKLRAMLDDQRRQTALLDQDRAIKMLADRKTIEDLVARTADQAKTQQQAAVDVARRLLERDTRAAMEAPKADLPPQTEVDRVRRAALGRSTSDLPSASPATAANSYILDLTMRLIDLRSDIDAARVRVAHVDTLAKQGAAGTEEQELAVIELKKAERKLSAVLRLIEVERTAAGVEIERVQTQIDEAHAAGTSTADLEARLKLLHLRLELLSQAI